MPLIIVVIILAVVGVLLTIVNRYLAAYIDAGILRIINVVVLIAVIIWLLKVFGVWAYLTTIKV